MVPTGIVPTGRLLNQATKGLPAAKTPPQPSVSTGTDFSLRGIESSVQSGLNFNQLSPRSQIDDQERDLGIGCLIRDNL